MMEGDVGMTESNAERLERIKKGSITGSDIPFIVEGFKRLQELVKDYNELFIQENAMQGHYQLAHKSMQMYKKCCDDITLAMNTERPAEEKTKDVRRILDDIK